MDELLLIDLSSIYWSCWHASVNKEVSTARNETVNRVRSLITRYPRTAICCDSAKSWRKDLAPTYKANRPEKDQQAINELNETKEMLRKDGALLWECETFEADDIIATATHHALARKWKVVIATGDKDLCQLVQGQGEVTILNTRDDTIMDAVGVKLKFGVRPSQMLDYLTLVGDASDNVKGVQGIGPKTACALLEKFNSINGIYSALDETPELFTKPAIKAALLESNDIVSLAQKLIALRDDCPIKFEEIDDERKPEPLTNEDVDMSEPEEEATWENPMQPESAPGKATVVGKPTELQRMPPRAVATPFEHGLEPNSLEYAVKLAVRLNESKLYAKKFPNQDAILAIIIRGRELGWGALAAMDAFHCFEGRPMLQAHAIISLVKAHPDCEYFTCLETTPESCTYETKHRRNPKPTKLTYTLQQARNAGLVRPGGNWDKRPDEMIRKTCAVQLARMEYPDAAMGIYSLEECGAEAA